MNNCNELFRINKIEIFSTCMQKLSVNPKELTSEEKNYILTVAALLMKKYNLDKRFKSYAELAYFIILNYSLAFDDYEPLYDFSISFGFYPISHAITKNHLLNFGSIANNYIEIKIEREYQDNNIIETYEQKKLWDDILISNANEKSFIAPTSFGKSQLILSHIKNFFDLNKKYAIIVPTKALLMQTYRNIKELNLSTRTILHDEMYKETDTGFIGVFTQERAFRLMNKNNISFDFMYIDEAHQLLEEDHRSIVLSRLIKLNKLRNPNCKCFYFSPLVSNSANLVLTNGQTIAEKRIEFNLKEPILYEYRTNGEKYVYNRFVNDFYKIETSAKNIFEYMQENKGIKNFIYLYTPKKIQQLATELSNIRTEVSNVPEIETIIANLNKYVHTDFYLIDCIKKGFIYIHGRLPDNIRDYLIAKFSKIPELSTIIANKVILEGINLPIDTLFILSSVNLKQKDLINLIGRVNRLNEIFGEQVDLYKLQPPIHFVNSDEYNRVGGKLENKIRELKKNSFVDELENPLLQKFTKPIDDEKKIIHAENVIAADTLFFSETNSELDKLRKKMIELGINNVYENNEKVIKVLFEKFSKKLFVNQSQSLPIMDRFYWLFIADLEDCIVDNEIRRLKNSEAISYYKIFLENRKLSLNEKISKEVYYFNKRKTNGDAYLYIGSSFGEISYPYNDNNNNNKVYVNLYTKTEKELINLAIIKQKQEDDFVSFKLFMFFQLMLDYDQMTKDEYEQIIYGSNDKILIDLIKQGLPINLATKLKNDNQINNIYFDEYNNIKYNKEFINYKESLDDFLKFEIDKIL